MANDPTLEQLNYKLDSHGELIKKQGQQLDGIQRTIQQLAVQDKEIKYLQHEQQKDRERIETLCATDGVISRIQNHQASCPRGQIKVLWSVVLPMGVSLLGVTYALISLAAKTG